MSSQLTIEVVPSIPLYTAPKRSLRSYSEQHSSPNQYFLHNIEANSAFTHPAMTSTIRVSPRSPTFRPHAHIVFRHFFSFIGRT